MGQTSPRKLEANRKNASQSTGPRTLEGKKKVRWNALRHGLLAQEVIIPVGPGQEDDGEFENLLVALRDDLQPFGALEEILVEQIAVCYWRLRRVLRAENGEIRSDLDDVPRSFRLQLTMQAALSAQEGLEPSTLRSQSFGLGILLGFLERLQKEVIENKSLSDVSLREIARYFGDGPEGLAALCSSSPSDPNAYLAGQQSATTPAQSAQSLMHLLEVEKTKLRETLQDVQQDEFQRLQADFDRLSLPKAAEKIVRYETAIERQLNRALYHLENIQKRRSYRKEKPSGIHGQDSQPELQNDFTKQTQTSTSESFTAVPESGPPESRSSPPGLGIAGCG